MILIESKRWQLFSQMLNALADERACASDCKQVLEWFGQITGADYVEICLDSSGQVASAQWGQQPGENSRSSREFIHPLERSSGKGYLRILGNWETDVKLVNSCFEAVATMIDVQQATAQKIRDERARRRLQESLQEISRALNSTLELEEVLALVLDHLHNLVPYDSANVMLLEDGVLVMHAARGYQDFSGPVDLSSISFVPARTYLMNEVLTGDQPLIVPDTHDVPEWIRVPCGTHIRSWMGVPLKVKGQAIGLFSIDKAVPDFFTRQHAELAFDMAAHAALALDNARMVAQIREVQKQLVGLSAQVIEAQEQERRKIAVELHDHTGQALLGLRAELQVLKHYLPADSPRALEQMKYLDDIVLELSQELRQIAHDLRPSMLSELGLIPALEQYIDEFNRRLLIPVNLEYSHERSMQRLPERIELICYRIVQEALTNLAKHAQASKVKISLELAPDKVKLSVSDDGIGFSQQQRKEANGFGLIGIRERVTSVGGSLQVFSKPGWGTQLMVEIPLEQEFIDA